MRILIVVDAQKDFTPVSVEDYAKGLGGALAVPNGDEIMPVVNGLFPKFDLVIFTKDWHPNGMDAFASSHKGKNPFDTFINADGVKDTLWPDHCVADTVGAEIHDDLDFSLIKGDFYIFKKGLSKNKHPYSGFGAEGLLTFLKDKNVKEVFVTGLATDYCVKDTVIDSAKAGFKTTVIWDACRGIAEDLKPTRDLFDKTKNVTVINSKTFHEK